jgi:Uma2 family endonuclease
MIHTRKMTLEEWAEMDEDDEGELVDGVLVEEEVGSFLNELVLAWLVRMLGEWVSARKGFIATSDVKYGLKPGLGRKPDMSIFFAGRKPPPNGLVRMPPDVAVEIISSRPRDSRRDRVQKLNEYAAFGIRFYWLLDPRTRMLEILELGGSGHYVVVCTAADGKVAVPGCEGLTLDLDDLWREIDRLGPSEE